MWKGITSVCILLTCYPHISSAILEPLEQPKYKVSLIDCILEVSKKYVNTKETITVALPMTDYPQNVSSVITSNQLLLEYLTSKMSWTVLTTNMKNYVVSITHLSLEKISKSYIIFIRSAGEFSEQIQKLKTLNSWNPHSKFLIVSATIFQNPLEVANEILHVLWKEELIDGIALLANSTNNLVFDIYALKPFAKGNCGKIFDGAIIINSCTNGVFERDQKLFTNTLPKRFSNCSILVGTTKVEPYVIKLQNNSVDTKEYYHTDHGIEVNLLNMIASVLNLEVMYFQASTGEITANGTATGNLLLLKKGIVDIAIGAYVKTFPRSYYFESSLIYLQDRLVWCVPHVPVLVDSQNFLKILDLTSWILLILLYLLSTGLLWFMGKINFAEVTTYRNYQNVSQNVFSIFLGLPVRFQPRTIRIRTVFIILVWFSFLLVSAYQSYLTSVLTGSRYGEKYDSVADIYKSNLKTYFVPNTQRYFEGEKFKYVLDKLIECEDYKLCMDFVAFDRDSAFCVPRMFVDYVYSSYVTKSNDPLLYCFGNVVSMTINMLMRKGFPLFSKINKHIGYIVSGGFITKWKKDILRKRAGNFVSNIDIGENNNHFLRLDNLIPVFLMLVIGHSLAFFIWIIEIKFRKK